MKRIILFQFTLILAYSITINTANQEIESSAIKLQDDVRTIEHKIDELEMVAGSEIHERLDPHVWQSKEYIRGEVLKNLSDTRHKKARLHWKNNGRHSDDSHHQNLKISHDGSLEHIEMASPEIILDDFQEPPELTSTLITSPNLNHLPIIEDELNAKEIVTIPEILDSTKMENNIYNTGIVNEISKPVENLLHNLNNKNRNDIYNEMATLVEDVDLEKELVNNYADILPLTQFHQTAVEVNKPITAEILAKDQQIIDILDNEKITPDLTSIIEDTLLYESPVIKVGHKPHVNFEEVLPKSIEVEDIPKSKEIITSVPEIFAQQIHEADILDIEKITPSEEKLLLEFPSEEKLLLESPSEEELLLDYPRIEVSHKSHHKNLEEVLAKSIDEVDKLNVEEIEMIPRILAKEHILEGDIEKITPDIISVNEEKVLHESPVIEIVHSPLENLIKTNLDKNVLHDKILTAEKATIHQHPQRILKLEVPLRSIAKTKTGITAMPAILNTEIFTEYEEFLQDLKQPQIAEIILPQTNPVHIWSGDKLLKSLVTEHFILENISHQKKAFSHSHVNQLALTTQYSQQINYLLKENSCLSSYEEKDIANELMVPVSFLTDNPKSKDFLQFFSFDNHLTWNEYQMIFEEYFKFDDLIANVIRNNELSLEEQSFLQHLVSTTPRYSDFITVQQLKDRFVSILNLDSAPIKSWLSHESKLSTQKQISKASALAKICYRNRIIESILLHILHYNTITPMEQLYLIETVQKPMLEINDNLMETVATTVLEKYFNTEFVFEYRSKNWTDEVKNHLRKFGILRKKDSALAVLFQQTTEKHSQFEIRNILNALKRLQLYLYEYWLHEISAYLLSYYPKQTHSSLKALVNSELISQRYEFGVDLSQDELQSVLYHHKDKNKLVAILKNNDPLTVDEREYLMNQFTPSML